MATPPSSNSAICIAISGPSSSGKTSLSRLLRAAFTSRSTTSPTAPPVTCTILHGDDFYLPDSQLPLVPLGGPDGEKVQDWDCPEALDFSRFLSSVRHAKSQGGRLPDDHVSYEQTHAVGVEESIARFLAADTGAGTDKIVELEKRVLAWLGGVEAARGCVVDTVVIVDGFLLFGAGVPEALQAEFDVKLMIRTPYEKAKKRREDREGYTTMEGFWHDPPGYFELLVWPAYVKQHSYLFQGGDMESGILTSAALDRGIRTPRAADQTLLETLEWAVSALEDTKL
ncbi:ribosylnicotinamide kinase [Orbilia brochopaga]|uniref:Ribosylnicotinamide kinase n=1 Tax=Orbilia brochopaga TaxID=3140254 RepID=A0AAV9VE23_9PEZI